MTTTRSRGSSRLQRVPWWLWSAIAVALIVGIVAAFGGFSDRVEAKTPVYELGEPYEGNEIRTTVDAVYLSPVQPVTGSPAPEGMQYVVVEATLENVTNQPTTFGREALLIEIDGAIEAGEEPRRLLELRTGLPLGFLQPGIASPTAFIWETPTSDVAEGDTVYVGIFERFPVANDPIFGDTAFTGPRFVARLETPAEARS